MDMKGILDEFLRKVVRSRTLEELAALIFVQEKSGGGRMAKKELVQELY